MSTRDRAAVLGILVATSIGAVLLLPILGISWDLSIALAIVVPLALAWVAPRYIIRDQ